MSIILRVDDFPGTKPEEFWKHNLDNFKRFDEVLAKYVDEYVLGVIPKHTTPQMVEFLEQNDRCRVALHGIEHDERYPNEFADYETVQTISEKLISVRQPFDRCNGSGGVVDYIPPHNVIDGKTVDALENTGFKRIFGGPGTRPSVADYIGSRPGLKFFYSHHPTWYGRSDELLDRDHAPLAIIREERDNPGFERVLTLHWPWEWNIGLQSLDRFLQTIEGVL